VVRGDSVVLAGDIQDNVELMEHVSIEKLNEVSKSAIEPLEWDFDTDLTA
jgi:hypothetical protein